MRRARVAVMGSPSAMEALFWLLLEAGLALGILIFIVWWTWPRRKPPGGRDRDTGEH